MRPQTAWFFSFVVMLSITGCVGCGGSPNPPQITLQSETAIFIGDSVTNFWGQNGNTLPIAGAINAGISSQTTSDILSRFDADVIAKHPSRVYILAGTNDMLRYQSQAIAIQNIESMVNKSIAANIKVFLGTVTPVAKDISNEGTQYCCHDFNQDIDGLNQQLSQLAIRHPEITLVDYHSALLDPAVNAAMPGMLKDGVHPTPSGYAAMDALIH